MRKFIIATMAFMLLTTAAQAQLAFGLKAGANFAKLKTNHADAGDEDQSTDTKTGFHGGLFVTVPVAGNFRIQPEILISMEGGKDKEENITYNLTYINVPVLLQYYSSGFIAEAGPQLGFPLAAKTKVGDLSVDIKDEMRSPVFSLALGAGYRFQNGIGVHTRYNLGLSHVLEGDTHEGSVRSHVIQLSLSFALGK